MRIALVALLFSGLLAWNALAAGAARVDIRAKAESAMLARVNALRGVSLLVPLTPRDVSTLQDRIGPEGLDALAVHAAYTLRQRLKDPVHRENLRDLGLNEPALVSMSALAQRTLAGRSIGKIAPLVRKVEAFVPSRSFGPGELTRLSDLGERLQAAEKDHDATAASLGVLEAFFSAAGRNAGDAREISAPAGGEERGPALRPSGGAAIARPSIHELPMPGALLARRIENRAKANFLTASFLYHLATSVMLLVQQTLLFETAKAAEMAKGVGEALAGLHAAGVVFGIATLTGATRMLGNPLASWLSRRTSQRNLGVLAAVGRALVLVAVALTAFHPAWLTPGAALIAYAALYSADWLIGSLEELAMSTIALAQVPIQSHRFKSWSTLPRFLAELNGFLGPLLVLGLLASKTSGFEAVGQWLAPILFGACAIFYFLIPKDLLRMTPRETPSQRISWSQELRALLSYRSLILSVGALALLSTTLLKGPLSLNMASLILRKSGLDLKIYTAILSGLFGAGLGLGAWMAHIHDETRVWRRSLAGWMAISALGTAALVLSWLSGFWPGAALFFLAPAWVFFALTNAVGRVLMSHFLQERVAAAGPGKNYVIGMAGSLSTAVITALRVLAGFIFFVMAGTWQQGFGLFGAALMLFAAGQLVISRLLASAKGPDEP